jgi:hypothetical protein
MECEADRNGLAVEPRAERGHPCRNGLGRVLEREALAFCGSRSLETPRMCGIRPVDAHQGSNVFV